MLKIANIFQRLRIKAWLPPYQSHSMPNQLALEFFLIFFIFFIDNLAAGQVVQSRKAAISRQKDSGLSTKYTNLGSASNILAVDSTNTHPSNSLTQLG